MQALEGRGLPPGVKIRLSGTADDLEATWDAMAINLLVAIAIVYLIMAVLFESFVYPLVIMLSVPLAAAGGVLGLAAVNTYQFQPLDMLTLLGFVILVGIVVNNAILLVHQTLFHMREEQMAVADAITTATRNRIRPIFMSTLTSVLRDAAAGAVPRRRLGALPRARLRRDRRACALRRAHAADRPAAAGGGGDPPAAQARTAEHGSGRPLARRHQRGMRPRRGAPLHDWELSPAQAIALQKALAGDVVRSDRLGPGGRRAIGRVAGVDAAFADGGRTIRAAAVLLDYPD